MKPGRRRYDPLNPPRWCCWRWRPINGDYRAFTGERLSVGVTDGVNQHALAYIETRHYLLRLYLCMTQLFSVCLHWINFPDPDPDPHDHQRGFFSVVLWGLYTEEVYEPLPECPPVCWAVGPRVRKVRWFNWKPYGSVHRIVAVEPGTLTLVIQGRQRAEWSFYVRDGQVRRPVPWLEYTAGTTRQS